MIYGDAILREQANKLFLDPIEIMQEYYENELYFLNQTIKFNNESNTITESSELTAIREGFVQTTINKIKEILQKFLDWLRGIKDKIMKLFIKDIEKVKKQLEDDIKNLQKAEGNEIWKYTKHIGKVSGRFFKKETIIRFSGEKYINDVFTVLESRANFHVVIKMRQLTGKLFAELDKNGKLTDDQIKQIDDLVKEIKDTKYTSITTTPKTNYYYRYSFEKARNNGMEDKQLLIELAMEDLRTINNIDEESKKIISAMQATDKDTTNMMVSVKKLEVTDDEKSVNALARLISAYSTGMTEYYNAKLGVLKSVQNYYGIIK